MYPAKFAASLLVLVALIFSVTPAQAETVNCTAITSLPAVITVQGVYCLTGHLNTAITAGLAIEIQTNNVIIDLNGFKLGGLAAGINTNSIGIYAQTRQNITVKNGTIRGFSSGIFFDGSQGHVVENIRADQNTRAGIRVFGNGHIIRNNQVVATGGTTLVSNADAYGIFASTGAGTRVLNNDVIDTFGTGAGIARGIIFVDCIWCLAVNNRITNANTGIEYRFTGTGKFRDNMTFNVTTPFIGGTNIGNNN